jgi:hypothetical protein
MATQTYCVAADVEYVLSAAGVTACLDDGEDGQRSAAEDDLLTRAIEIAAGKINQRVRHQYKLTDLAAGNDWLRDCNAYLAAKSLAERRGNPSPQSLMDECKDRERLLEEIRWGREQIPQQNPSFDHSPTVTNFEPELGRYHSPIRVRQIESTGEEPEPPVKRWPAGGPLPY